MKQQDEAKLAQHWELMKGLVGRIIKLKNTNIPGLDGVEAKLLKLTDTPTGLTHHYQVVNGNSHFKAGDLVGIEVPLRRLKAPDDLVKRMRSQGLEFNKEKGIFEKLAT